MITDDELDRRMLLADPARGLASSDDSLGELLGSTGVRVRSTRPRSRRRLFTGLGVAGIVLIGGATALPAAADAIREFLAQSDWTCNWGSECIDKGGQWIDTGAPDFVEYSASVYPYDLPLPDGIDQEAFRVSAAEGISANPGLQEEIGVVRSFEHAIYCVWVTEWLERDDAGDVPARDAASRVLIDYASWPGFVATDGGGLAERQLKAGEAALDGDRGAVRRSAQENACSPAETAAQ